MRGYFFSLEALVAAMILMSAVMLSAEQTNYSDNREEQIYRTMDALESNGMLRELTDDELQGKLTAILGFEINVNPKEPNGALLNYLLTEGTTDFRIIQIEYFPL